mmetsp:Transcript_24200/g.40076  ORF Transcript_24200/g.40076 Transcript_24200/m.40076 type:complete len:475 (-) Transcript_24200:110-1534(-)|eukprot:CAMPEP_0119006796 /NCGR_PEP_ID=MMETSP1176-20130426/2544_1 /TAXON_ID=265551 /ORGANISM="Synedropsis recta cf, Strain CCMP1620" /LENGTH=474 /DNA_ID=CAMNT_0006958793 /DNA_START=68 /DNA_END=1492 /DNA_ORIENTATION=-
MVQGLAFLSKKSWHVKNMANQEKVWIEEQKKAAEETKTKELAKQIQQEREEEEMDRIAGKTSNRLDRGIDWMYQGVTSEAAKEDAKKQAEEYLMGKEFTGGASMQPQGDLAQGEDKKEGFNFVMASVANEQPNSEDVAPSPAVASMAGPSVAEKNEAFRVRHEDPMFLVSQKRREQEVKGEKKKALYERVVGKVVDVNDAESDENSRKRRKREKKERKKDRKQRKEEKRRRRDRSRSRSDSDDDQRYRRRSPEHRKRSVSPDDYKKRSRYGEYSDEDYTRRDGNDKRSRYDTGRRDASDHRRRYDDTNSLLKRNSDNDRFQARRRDEDSSSRRDDRRYNSGRHGEEPKRENSGNYGLQRSSKPLDLKYLGPSRELLAQRHNEQLQAGRRPTPIDRRRMTPAEREQALRKMQADASRHNANRTASRPVEYEEERKSAAFLHRMAQETHGIGAERSMAARVAQNKHTNQKSSDAFF